MDYALGALTGRGSTSWAKTSPGRRTTSSAPIPGLRVPEPSAARPGECRPSSWAAARAVSWAGTDFGETRVQLDVTFGASEQVDLYAGGE